MREGRLSGSDGRRIPTGMSSGGARAWRLGLELVRVLICAFLDGGSVWREAEDGPEAANACWSGDFCWCRPSAVEEDSEDSSEKLDADSRLERNADSFSSPVITNNQIF